MPEHLRVDRQEVITNSDVTTNSRSLSTLPSVDTGISIGGTWHPVFRPLATKDGIPYLGVEGHGADNDGENLPNQGGEAAPIRDDPGETLPDYTDLMLDADPIADGVQVPVLVSVVPAPKVAITKQARTVTLFDGKRTSYTGSAFAGPDPVNVVALAADPTRARVTLQLGQTYSVVASQAIMYFYAVSHDPMFTDYLVIPVLATQPASSALVLENCTEPLYFTILPITAYDPTKTNASSLVAVVERATVANANPVR